jgi:hypothetical protein
VYDYVVFLNSYLMNHQVAMAPLSCWYVNSIAAHAHIHDLVNAIMKGTKQS